MPVDKKILSIDSDDTNEGYEEFSQFLDEDTQRKKNYAAKEITQMGDIFVKEISRKNKSKKLKAKKLISYIIKKCDGKYDEEELNSYSFEDVQNIYNEIKIEKRPAIIKFFHFVFNL